MEAKHILRYLHGTVGYGLRYVSCGDVKLQGYTDSDWAGSVVDQKSTSGCCFSLGSGMISWLSRKKTLVEFNTSKEEYISVSVASREAVWLRKLLARILYLELEPNLLRCDNKSCVKLTENPIFHEIYKNIEIKYHYIWEMVERRAVELQYISMDEQITNILTKSLSRVKYEYFKDKL
jgi:hypothetical protein